MKFLKSLLLCFLFFGLGNFKAQNFEYEPKVINDFQIRFSKILNSKYKNKKVEISQNIKDKLKIINDNYANIYNNDYEIYLKKLKASLGKPLYPDIEYVKFQYLKIFPDINAVFFNRGNLLSEEKISAEEKQKYNELFLEIAKQIPNETYLELSKITDEINKDKFALTIPYRFEIFQDLFDENQRKRIDIINFLLWNF